MISKLRIVANKMLDSNNITDERRSRIILIDKLLQDDNCFYKIDMDTAYNILRDLDFSNDDAIKIYKELIDSRYYNIKEA